MNGIYSMAGFMAIFGYFAKIDGMFMIFSMVCIVAVGFGYLIRGYRGDRYVYQDHLQLKQVIFTRTAGRVITFPILVVPLYYFFPIIVSWCFAIYCALAFLNILKSFFDKRLRP